MSIRIGLGLAGFPFSGPESFFRWVDACEDTGVDSLWLSERLVSVQPVLEPMTALAAIAGRTRRLKFGMNAVVLPLRDPLVLAKECATIDYLSGGRLLPAFGVGNDTAPEWRATGQATQGRGARANEALQAMSRLWSEEHVTFRGRYYVYEDVTISPRPKQSPLPLWIGGSSPAAVERTARYGTGWIGGSGRAPRQVAATVTAIKAALRESGRSIEVDHYGIGFQFRLGSWDEPVVLRAAEAIASRLAPGTPPGAVMAVGGPDEVVALVREFVAAGVSKFVLRPLGTSDDDFIEQSLRLAREVLPVVHAAGFAAVA